MAERSRKRPRRQSDESPTPSDFTSPAAPSLPASSPPASPLPVPSAFSVSAIGRQMRRDRPDSVTRIGSGASVYMTAVLESERIAPTTHSAALRAASLSGISHVLNWM